MPDIHPHALKGAIVSLAVMWRLPVLHARDPEDALRILRFLAQQAGDSEHRELVSGSMEAVAKHVARNDPRFGILPKNPKPR